MKKNYYAKVLALTVAASMVSVPAFADEGDGTAVAVQEQKKEGENGQISKDSEEETKEQTVAEETSVNGVTKQNAIGAEPVALAEDDEETKTVEIKSAEQIYALARILGDAGTDEDYQLFIPKNDAEGTDDETTSELTNAEKTALKAKLQTAKYELADNISLSNENGFCGIPDFKGTFDGKNYTITLTIDYSNYYSVTDDVTHSVYRFGGVFRNIEGATIQNIVLKGKATGTFTNGKAVEGKNSAPKLTDIGYLVGGSGTAAPNTISNIESYVETNMTMDNQNSTAYLAAIIGRNTGNADLSLTMTDCVNYGKFVVENTNTNANASRVAGLGGHVYDRVVMQNCENRGDITVTGDSINAGSMVGSGNVEYKGCVVAGNISVENGAISPFSGMRAFTEKEDGNVIRVSIKGEPNQVITSNDVSAVIGEDGTATLDIPVYRAGNPNDVQNYTKYNTNEALKIDNSGSAFLFSVNNKKFFTNINTADASTSDLPFSSWGSAYPITSQDDLITLQNALKGNKDAIDTLYKAAGLEPVSNTSEAVEEAAILLSNGHYVLDSDIEITDPAFTSIGDATRAFGGYFDGNNKTVTLKESWNYENKNTDAYYGLFGVVSPQVDGACEIKNVNVTVDAALTIPADVTANTYTTYLGGFAGRISGAATVVDNVSVTVKKLEVTNAAADKPMGLLDVGGAFGYCGKEDVDLTVSVEGPIKVDNGTSTTHVNVGVFAAHALGKVSPTVLFKDGQEGVDYTGTATCDAGVVAGYTWSEMDYTNACIRNESGTPVVIDGGGDGRVGLLQGYHTTAGVAADKLTSVIDTVTVDGSFTLKGRHVGGYIGWIDTKGKIVIKNSVLADDIRIQPAEGVASPNYGGFIGCTGSAPSSLSIENVACGATVEAEAGSRGALVGGLHNTNEVKTENLVYANEVSGRKAAGFTSADKPALTGNEIKLYEISNPVAYTPIEVLTENAPAQLGVLGDAQLEGKELQFTGNREKKVTFTFNGKPFCTKTFTVTAKDVSSTAVITGVQDKYISHAEAEKALEQIQVVEGGRILTAGTDYDVTRTEGEFKITFKGAYKGEVTKTYSIENAFEVSVNDYVGNYDGTEHGIDVTNALEGVTMKYGDVAGTYDKDSITGTNAGTTVVYWQATKDGQTVTGTALIQINKAPVTLNADRTSMRGAGTVTLTVNGVVADELDDVTVASDDVTVSGSNGVYTAYLPNATKTYTFTVKALPATRSVFNENNYTWDDTSCTVSVSRKKSSSSSSDTSAPTYGVSTGKTENGTISVTPAKAEAGEKVTIKATPDSGYQLDKVTVKDKDNSNVKLTKVNDNEYTFTMPKGKVSVDATFVQKDAADANQNSAAEKSKVIKLQIGSRIVNVDNEAVIYDAAPVIRNDRTLVPIRIVTETLGGKVDWNGATKEVTLHIDGKEIKMTVGKTLEKYGVAPVIIDGRTFVPVRFVADELGATVAWDDATKTVTITKIEK